MSLQYVGSQLPLNDQWGTQENRLINDIKIQIENCFTDDTNLFINLTWFGPQFNNACWKTILHYIENNQTFDRIFWMAGFDPPCLVPDQFTQVEHGLKVKEVYYLGAFDNSKFSFYFPTVCTAEEIVDYAVEDLVLTNLEKLYLCYNRKPKPHRINLVRKILDNNLESYGTLTLGKNDSNYNVSEGIETDLYLTIDDDVNNYGRDGKFAIHKNFGGVPYDLCSLGRIDIWQNHFLNIVSETEFNPWDNMFVTEKTWKPMIGLRPFVLNGQLKIYQWLRDNGFKTFTHCFNGIELENLQEFAIHDAIVSVIKYLTTLDKQEILAMYKDILPDLHYNRNRFFEFAKEQKYLIDHLFE